MRTVSFFVISYYEQFRIILSEIIPGNDIQTPGDVTLKRHPLFLSRIESYVVPVHP